MTITDRKLRSTGALQGSSFSRVCQPNNCSSISVSRSVATDSKFCFVLAVLLACPACQDLTAKSVKKSALKVNFIQVHKIPSHLSCQISPSFTWHCTSFRAAYFINVVSQYNHQPQFICSFCPSVEWANKLASKPLVSTLNLGPIIKTSDVSTCD